MATKFIRSFSRSHLCLPKYCHFYALNLFNKCISAHQYTILKKSYTVLYFIIKN